MISLNDIFLKKHSGIFDNRLPYLIAEIGLNYDGKKELAKELILLAKKGKANAVKFQLISIDDFLISGYSAYSFFKEYATLTYKDFIDLKEYSKEVGIEFLGTPFSKKYVDFLVNVSPAIKIASSDITNIPFLDYIASYNKPILISTGGAKLQEIDRAIETISRYHNNICIMYCKMIYPTSTEEVNLGGIAFLKERYSDFLIGYSDHVKDEDNIYLIIAHLLGATIIEKHFTYDKSKNYGDHIHSYDFSDFLALRNKFLEVKKMLGTFSYFVMDKEKKNAFLSKRYIISARAIEKGEKITLEALAYKRIDPKPGNIPVDDFMKVLGKRIKKSIKKDTPLCWGDLL